MKFSLFSAVLFCVGLMSVMVTGQDRPPTCCHTVSNTRVPVENIEDYTIQHSSGVCAVAAVRFLTKKNLIICSDPENNWAKKVMKIVDGRKITQSMKPNTCFTSTTNIIPTTTNKTPTPENETSTSTAEPPKVTRIETSGPKTETSTTTTQQTSVSKETPKSSSSTAKTCGTGGPAPSPIKTTPGQDPDQTTSSRTTNTETTSTATTTSPPKTKPSKLKIKIISKKSKKRLRKYQYKPRI